MQRSLCLVDPPESEIFKNTSPVGKVDSNINTVPFHSQKLVKFVDSTLSKHIHCQHTVAGVAIKYGKCHFIKSVMPRLSMPIMLHNPFQCLQGLHDSQSDALYNEVQTHNIVHQNTGSWINQKKSKCLSMSQHSDKCNPPSRTLGKVFDPLLVSWAGKTI